MVKLCAATALSFALGLLGQESASHYDALKQALGLSDAQLSQLQQKSSAPVVRPAPTANPGPTAIYPAPAERQAGNFAQMARLLLGPNEDSLRVLDDSQRAKLAAIQKVWDRWDAVAFAIQYGLIDEKLWPGGSASICFNSSIRSYAYTKELGLRETQMKQFDQLKQDAQATHTRPPLDSALAVLDETQRANLAAFETALQVANEAIKLKLIPVPAHGEVLCH